MSRSTFARKRAGLLCALACLLGVFSVAEAVRTTHSLETGWRTHADPDPEATLPGFADWKFVDDGWKAASVPHNWDRYEGFRQAKHGQFHGRAWYRRLFEVEAAEAGRRVFLFFEGVGSYATVWVNGEWVGEHAGGLTTFTLDITDQVRFGEDNLLAVRADHPAGIRDLPWVCGGCELAYGFSEGSQPFGIFRPVSLVVTDALRIEPFGIHIWNTDQITREQAVLFIDSEIRNHGRVKVDFQLVTRLVDPSGLTVFRLSTGSALPPGGATRLRETSPLIRNPQLWSPDHPVLYRLVSELIVNEQVVDRVETPYGIRWIEWPRLGSGMNEPLRINGDPFFVNGVADYEHLLGQSHAFSEAQIKARASQIRAAGFNAFRDAHHPHNLRFNGIWDREGVLWWTQFGAHIWFENGDFQANYKALLRDWVRERRNSPSLFLYGLQNESKLPEAFARECLDIIREMDPTASRQRLVTTCNGGMGTDWDVPQNWSGTYGGDLSAYPGELKDQQMVGEYGAWRSLDLHSEGGYVEKGPLSEDRMTALMETKVRLAETVRDEVIGHFAWPFTTHQNPGRNVGSQGEQTADGIRELDRIGPANNKGLISIWGEPLDVFYMYRSHYAPVETEPMVYIVSHTWPDRWTAPGTRDGLIVYSNCEEVELFNDYRARSLGVRSRGSPGTPFRWDGVDIQTNVLYAEGRVGGRVVATDLIQLHHLPEAPHLPAFDPDPPDLTAPPPGYSTVYRVNAGGPGYLDANGQHWEADRFQRDQAAWGSRSWAGDFPNLHPLFGSKRRLFDPVRGTADDPLFQSFRYGRDDLSYVFPVPDGDYLVELFFIEPWYGTGGGMDCTGWRLFDVAVNGQTRIRDLDIWKEAGRAYALKKSLQASALNGRLEISFPRTRANQAVISAIAILRKGPPPPLQARENPLIRHLQVYGHPPPAGFSARTWLDTGMSRLSGESAGFTDIPWELREAEWIQVPRAAVGPAGGTAMQFTLGGDATVYVLVGPDITGRPEWMRDWNPTSLRVETVENGGTAFQVLSRQFPAGAEVRLGGLPDPEGSVRMVSVVVKERFPPPPALNIQNLETSGSLYPDGWRAVGNFRTGRPFYRDKEALVGDFSSRLSDVDWIQTAEADALNPALSARFSTGEHTEVFVALDPRIKTLPDWLADWIPIDWQVRTAPPHARSYSLLKKRFSPGESITLGPNGRLPGRTAPAMYGVLLRIVRAERQSEAEDLPGYSALLAADQTDWSGRGYLDLASLETPRFDWLIEVGVGDRYGLNFRYRSASGDPVLTRLLIIAPDGKTVCEESVTFAPTPGHDWTFSRNRTCDSINAGTYRVRLVGDGLRFLDFDAIVID